MSKIDLGPITSGYNLSKINANFQKIEDELNNKVLYRDSPAGEPNNMSSNLDMNSRSILNASKISSNVLELGGVQVVPTNLATDPYNGTREALRRSYAEVGYNLVDGSFETGGVLVNANDVLLQERTGKAFSGPAGKVAAGTNPAIGGFVDRSGDISVYAGSYGRVRAYSGTSSLIYCGGRTSVLDGAAGHFVLDATDTTSADNDCTTLVGVGGKRWKRVYSGAVKAEWAGVIPGSSYVHTELLNLIANFNSAVFRAGNYKLNATILVQDKSFRFIGQGPRATFFDFYNAGDHLSFKSVNGGFNDFSGIVDCCVRNLSAAAANAITV